MFFAVKTRDHEAALNKRLAARPAHLTLSARLQQEGKLIFAGALLDDQETMTGSLMIFNVVDRSEIDAWLNVEPYVVEGVWNIITIEPLRIAPSFAPQAVPA